jgi:hypothetical protein
MLAVFGARRATCSSALFGDVDLVAAEHRIAPFHHPALARELQQQSEGLVGNAVLRVVQMQSGTFDHQAFAASRIVGEEVPQMRILDLLVMRLQSVPRYRLVRPLLVCHTQVLP